jgi:hypothetical protein
MRIKRNNIFDALRLSARPLQQGYANSDIYGAIHLHGFVLLARRS